jgi:hypothetical protein
MILDTAIHSRAAETFLEESAWLDISTSSEVERLYEQYGLHYDSYFGQLVVKLGVPTLTEVSDPERASEFYPEAFRLAVWRNDAGSYFLACGQHDRETPVFVSFGCRSAA